MAKTVDIRTYIALERAFVRRLQRAWRINSAPIYQKITQACLDHKWDEARRLVTDLDMTEVGTQNREWITYMLLSCGVFGANMVAKGKPSFVGVGSFDTFLKQTTNNMLQYLEFNATAQIQKDALQLIAEDEAQTKALKYDPAQPRDKSGRWTYGSHETKWAVRGYVEGVGQSINAYLREGASAPHGAAPDWAREYVVLMDEHMQRNHLPEDTSLTRTISNRRAEDLNVGDIYQDNGYVSTTRNASRIHDIRDDIGASSEYQAVMTIQAPKGLGHIDVNKEIGNDHRYAHQNEIILPRGTKFQVVSKQILGRWGNKMTVKVVQ